MYTWLSGLGVVNVNLDEAYDLCLDFCQHCPDSVNPAAQALCVREICGNVKKRSEVIEILIENPFRWCGMRFWTPRFSLRLLLAGLLGLSVCFGYLVSHVHTMRREQSVVAPFKQNGGSVGYRGQSLENMDGHRSAIGRIICYFTGLSEFAYVEMLFAGDAIVDDADVKGIGQLKYLNFVDLSGTRVGDSTLAELPSLHELEYLGISDYMLSVGSAEFIVQCRSLKILAVYGRLDSTILEHLRYGLPHCRIIHFSEDE